VQSTASTCWPVRVDSLTREPTEMDGSGPTPAAADTVTVSVGDALSSERSMPPVTLRSVQLYRSQDEYIVVMKEDLAEWLNELYDMTMTADDLFQTIETGVLLCRYACTVNEAVKSSRDVRCEPVLYRERGVEAGSFQARVNVAAFLTWCRRAPLRMPDDVLFETGDLIRQPAAERNERQVALSLLEVGRRSAALRLGLPAPQLVRLEAEIDAEIRADDCSAMMMMTTDSNTHDIDDDDDDEEEEDEEEEEKEESASNSRQSTAVSASRSKTRSIRAPSVIVSRHRDEATADETLEPPPPPEKRGSVWQRRRYRPIIPVDMMTLDEMACLVHRFVMQPSL